MHIRAFKLHRDAGNVLLYASPTANVAAFTEVGGIARAYLNHRHEAAFGEDLRGVPLFVHAADRDAVAATRNVGATFSRSHRLDHDLEVIPIPGHRPGATAYLCDNGVQRVLFTGDAIHLRDGEWVAAVLDSSDRAAYVDSLELIRELDYDLVVPWAATADGPTTPSRATPTPAAASTRSSSASAAGTIGDQRGQRQQAGVPARRPRAVTGGPVGADGRRTRCRSAGATTASTTPSTSAATIAA